MAENQEQDEEEENGPEPFEEEEALDLARQGKDAWNAWAEENPGREVDFADVDFTTEENKAISFQGFTFPGDANFSVAKFKDAEFNEAVFKGNANFSEATFEVDAGFGWATFAGYAEFGGATFEREAGFDEATFEGKAGFGDVTFEGDARFYRATFEGDSRFDGATFAGSVDLNGSRFETVPDFRATNFEKHLTLHGIEVDFRRPADPADADRYRRLKDFAVAARDHEREQMFFAYELMAKRGYETRGLALVPNYLYGWLSGFGRSLWRPSIGLFVVWGTFGVLYSWIAVKDWSHIWDGLLFSAAQLFPFLGASKGALADAKAALFGNAALDAWVNALGMIEGVLGVVFLFLIVLALRNRFRI